jgi:predicted ATPase
MSIKTPDQKLRVFISSTIDELAEERKIAREAINKLRLIPVLFELGARPHPPRELYRAYLEQSQIFIAFYWNSYGWIAPDMDISGVEDEFNLSEGKPRLIYVKEPSPGRQSRLAELLAKIQKTDSACYKKFSNSRQLRELLENDLAILLSERFQGDEIKKDRPGEKVKSNLPIIRDSIIGRENELRSLQEMISNPEVGLITVTGAGGTGKTRLSLQLLRDIKDDFNDGPYFVSLASVTDPKLVPATIALEIGLIDNGKQPILDTLLEYLNDKKTVLPLDNFEQITDAAIIVSSILGKCPLLKIIVTSRTPLYLRGEHIFPLSPLSNPDSQTDASVLHEYPAIQLFMQRANEVNPHLVWDSKNLEAVSAICKHLDGLPLAIELAAARSKFFPPILLLAKMKKMLDVLSQGPKDLPLRQQTMRATIDWSINLLDEAHQRFFRRLSVFNDSWTLETADAIANQDQQSQDVAEMTEKLIDFGLVQSYSWKLDDEETEIRFRMLQPVKEYGSEIFSTNAESQKIRNLHAKYFIEKSTESQALAWSLCPPKIMSWFDVEYENLRQAFSTSSQNNDLMACWQIIGNLDHYWVRHGGFGEAFEWMKSANVNVNDEEDEGYKDQINPEIRAHAYWVAGILRYFAGHYEMSLAMLEQSARIFANVNNITNLARAKAYIGLVKLNLGDTTGNDLAEAIEFGQKSNDILTVLLASSFMSEVYMARGEYEKATIFLDETENKANEFQIMLGIAVVSQQKANLYYQRNLFLPAIDYFIKSIDQFTESGFAILNGWNFINLAGSYTELHDYAEAKKYLEKGLENARTRGEKPMMIVVMIYYVRLYIATGNEGKAVRIYSAIETLKSQHVTFGEWSTHKKVLERLNTEISPLLSERMFADEQEQGRKLGLEQLIRLITEKENEVVSE